MLRRIPRIRITKKLVVIMLIVILVATALCLVAVVVTRISGAAKMQSFVAEMTATKGAWDAWVTPTFTPEDTSTPAPTATSWSTPTASVTAQTEEAVVLSTATSTPVPSPTVGFSPTPESIIVSQSFASGLGDWEATDSSAVNIVNGSFYGTWLVFEMPNGVKNFQIEIEGRASGTGTGVGIYISPAFKTPEDNLYFRTNPIDREWRFCQGGPCQELSGLMRGVQDADVIIVVTVAGQNVNVKINDVEVASFYNNKINDATKVAIGAFGAGSSLTSVKITQLP